MDTDRKEDHARTHQEDGPLQAKGKNIKEENQDVLGNYFQ